MRSALEPAASPELGGIRLLRAIAAAGAILVMAILASSAYIRLTQAGLGCAPWPACYGTFSGGDDVDFARAVHRATASIAGILAIALAIAGWNVATDRKAMRRTALGLLALVAFLAVLGRSTTGSTLPAVTLGNVLGGMAMLALFARVSWIGASTYRVFGGPSQGAWTSLRLVAACAFVLVLLQIALGTLVSTRLAGAACGADPFCAGAVVFDAALLDPFRAVERLDPVAPSLAALQLLHRAFGIFTLASFIWAAWRCAPYRGAVRTAGFAMPVLGAVAIALAWFGSAHELPRILSLLHNALAAMLLALAANLNMAAWHR
jgi:cytochrome c oxidase assembly protein subunit 15